MKLYFKPLPFGIKDIRRHFGFLYTMPLDKTDAELMEFMDFYKSRGIDDICDAIHFQQIEQSCRDKKRLFKAQKVHLQDLF